MKPIKATAGKKYLYCSVALRLPTTRVSLFILLVAFVKRRPAAFLFISALSGALLGIAWPGRWWLGALGALLVIMLFPRIKWLGIISLVLFTLFVAAWSASYEQRSHNEKLSMRPLGDTIFDGVVQNVRQVESGSKVLTARIQAANQPYALPMKVSVRLEEALSAMPVMPGQAIRLRGIIKPFTPALSPVHFDGERYAQAQGLHGSITLGNSTRFWVSNKRESAYFAHLRLQFRERVLHVVTPHEASLLLALMIGDTDLMSPEQDDLYRVIGAQHLLAVSGLQVTLLSFLCFFMLTPIFVTVLGKYLYRAQALSALVTIVLTFWFIGLAGFSSSSVRAFLMTSFLLLPTMFARRIDQFDALYASGLVVVLAMPLVVLDVGFWLSYAAVVGLLLAHVYTSNKRIALAERSLMLSWIFSACTASMAAFLATLPILITVFGSFAPYSIAANLVLVPLGSLVQVPAIICGLIGCIFDWPALISIAAVCANVIEIWAEVLARIFGAIVCTPAVSLWWLLLILAVLVIAAACWKKNWWLSLVGMALFFAGLIPILSQRDLEVVVLAVGQGDATLFSTPHGKHILLDAGGQPYGNFDPGARIVVPTLHKKGVSELEVLIISHPDPDHILGAFAVLDQLKVNQIWHSGFKEDHPLTQRLMAVAKQKGIVIKSMPELLGRHVIDSVEFNILAPNTFGEGPYFAQLSANDNSLVVSIRFGGHTLLWPGDLEAAGEQNLLVSGTDLKADVVKAPHHGSKTSSTPALVKATMPAHVIYSTGINNRFNFPHDEVVTRWNDVGAEAWNTGSDGELTITVTDKEISIKGFRRRQKAAG